VKSVIRGQSHERNGSGVGYENEACRKKRVKDGDAMIERQPGSLPKLLRMIARGDFAELHGRDVVHVNVYHDDGCPALRGGVCRCAPEVRVGEVELWVERAHMVNPRAEPKGGGR
jgi:hypothetical protein